jgi:hypothetical protein
MMSMSVGPLAGTIDPQACGAAKIGTFIGVRGASGFVITKWLHLCAPNHES